MDEAIAPCQAPFGAPQSQRMAQLQDVSPEALDSPRSLALAVSNTIDVNAYVKQRKDRASADEASGGTKSRATNGTTTTSLPEDSRRLSLVAEKKIRRGVRLERVLAGFGRILGTLELSASETPQAIYDLSEEVERLDDFISHDWASSRWQKLLTLLVVHNSTAAAEISILVSLVVGACHAAGWLDSGSAVQSELFFHSLRTHVELKVSFFGLFLPPAAFLAVLVFWQRIRQVLRLRTKRVFLDKICVHQTDEKLKTAAILSFAGFLDATDKLVILWSPRYLSRLWCVYEIASWVKLKKDFVTQAVLVPIQIVPVLLITMGFIFFASVNKLYPSPTLYQIMMVVACLSISCSVHQILSAFTELKSGLTNFEVRKAECACSLDHQLPTGEDIPCDRLLVYRTMNEWFQAEGDEDYLDRFDSFIKNSVCPALTKHTFGRVAILRLGLLAYIGTVWCAVATASSAHPVLDAVGPDITSRWVIGQLLPAFLHFPCIPVFTLWSLAIYNRLLGEKCIGSKGGRLLRAAGGVALSTVVSGIAMLIPVLSVTFLVEVVSGIAMLIPVLSVTFLVDLENPWPFALALAAWSVVCLAMFLVPWQP